MVQYAQHKEATNKNMKRNNIIIWGCTWKLKE